MDELIAKLEAAKEGSRELDAEIFEAWSGKSAYHDARGFSGATVRKMIQGLPAYTTSIDAALTLVPDGLFYELRSQYRTACIRKRGRVTDSAKAATIPLALCIAALRAVGKTG